jgi:acetoin utilization deacetylase AcuC-like enzyme
LIDLRKVPFDENEAWASIASVHDPAYVDAVRTGQPEGPARSQGFRWSSRFANSVARISAGHLEAFLNRVRPELVMFQAGMDPYEHDPVGGIPGVDEAFLRRRDAHVIAEVSSRRIPLVVNIAGGYVDGVERLHLMTIRAMALGLA